MDERLAALEERLARAEGELRSTREQVESLQQRFHLLALRSRMAGFAGVVTVAAALCFAGAQPSGSAAIAAPGSKVRAPFTVVGRGNKPLLQVVEIQGSGGYLRLLDHNGKEILEAGLLRGDGFRGIRANDENNRPAGAIGQQAAGGGIFRGASAHDEQGNRVVDISHGDGIGPLGMEISGLTVLTPGGLPLIDAGIRADNGQVGFDIADPAGAGREGIRIGFRPPNGLDPGLRGLEIDGVSGAPLVAVEANEFFGEITLFNHLGEIVFEAPEFP